MALRGTFDPTNFDRDDQNTWPPAPIGAITYNGEAITYNGEAILGFDIEYADGDTWNVVADGTFQGLTLKAGGRLIARVT